MAALKKSAPKGAEGQSLPSPASWISASVAPIDSAVNNLNPQPADPLPLSLLNDFLYCPRRAALKAIEGWREANEHTVSGDIVHEHTDLPGYEVAKGVTVLRALPVWSERLGLSGKCDVVEVQSPTSKVQGLKSKVQSLKSEDQGAGCGAGDAESKSESPYVVCYDTLVPVEYKKGKGRAFENDDAQLCAQGLCLEEMFGVRVDRGAVFHAASKRRREVEFTAELRRLTQEAVGGLRQLLESERVPAAVFRPACEECSLYEVCLPQLTAAPAGIARATRRLFEA